MTETATAAQLAKTDTGRIVGLDIARAFAMIGMVIVNFKVAMSAEDNGAPWLKTIAAIFDGRAAATFVVLAGIGASLGSRRARESNNPALQRSARITLAKRALFLFVLGWAFYPIWEADILHFYGRYLAIGSVVLFAPDKRLLTVAAVSCGACSSTASTPCPPGSRFACSVCGWAAPTSATLHGGELLPSELPSLSRSVKPPRGSCSAPKAQRSTNPTAKTGGGCSASNRYRHCLSTSLPAPGQRSS